MDKPTEKIRWTERASADVEAIVRYLKRRNPEAAAQIGRSIFKRVEILWDHPEIGGYLDELRDQGWRKLVYRRWKIVYTYRERIIIIGRVWPAAMGKADLTTPLDPGDD